MDLTKKTTLFNKKDLIAYFLIAGAGAIVQLVCGGLLKDWFKLNYEATILPAYFLSVIVGFALTKLFALNMILCTTLVNLACTAAAMSHCSCKLRG